MTSKELIISLIQQDIKNSQLVLGLDNLGLEASEKYGLEVLDIVADLMQVPEGHMEFYWGRMYMSYMSESSNLDKELSSDSLHLKAETCYDDLNMVLHSGIVL
jgi:hypothetical protein